MIGVIALAAGATVISLLIVRPKSDPMTSSPERLPTRVDQARTTPTPRSVQVVADTRYSEIAAGRRGPQSMDKTLILDPSAITGYVERPSIMNRCETCHLETPPEVLPKDRWARMIDYMNQQIVGHQLGEPFSRDEMEEIARYYIANSPEELPELPPDSPIGGSVEFVASPFGRPAESLHPEFPPHITDLNVVDLNQDGKLDVLISDLAVNGVTWAYEQENGRWNEILLASDMSAVHTEVFDFEGDGDLDIVVATIGSFGPNDGMTGGIFLILNDGSMKFTATRILEHVPRIADVRPGDLDGDGDVDFSVALFGGWQSGMVGWLEQITEKRFELRTIEKRNGCSHTPIVDINDDGVPDIVAVISQQHEEVVAYIRNAYGLFSPTLIYKAPHPMFGLVGIEVVDLDGDGDLDLVLCNGDALDNDAFPKPYHGVRWLENQGDLHFKAHELTRLYGAYATRTFDLDGDQDLDIVAASQMNDWNDSTRASLIWLENDGRQTFTRHTIATAPTHLGCVDVGDLDRNGHPDILAGGLHVLPPYDRIGRVSFFANMGLANGRN